MREISEWLEKLGMSEYAQSFAENDIDLAVLGDLTDQDLKELGVTSLGHRRKILRASAELGNAPAAAAVPPSPRPAAASLPAPSAASPPIPDAAGERRYLTVMFCDLVGSTGISAQLDAEEWRDLVGSYLDAASAAVIEMGGYVAKKLGDGLMSLFGYPVAHENDAERAARAALAIQHALAELNRKNEGTGKPVLAARIGLETGPAVVDTAGEIYGDGANVAARVQALAEPGAVLVTARVQRQVAGLFVAEDRGTHTLKGVPEPTALFKLVRASGGGRRSGQRNLTPLVGRDDEMAMLLRRWERVRQGDGQLVMIVGEPGLGKSRLIEEFHARLTDTPHTWVEWSCSQLLQNTPLHPIAEWGRVRFGGADVPAERRLADLESSLAQVKLDPAENASLLAPLLDIPLPKDRAPALAAEELRRRQLAALTNWVMAGAKVQPVVLAFEDLHWADPTTLDVLRGIAERGALAPLFILATTRPEFRPPWSVRSHHGTVSLAPLDRTQVRDMVAELSARHALPRDVVEDVAARTGGVPLFVEEVTRLLLERGEGGGGIQAIPPTLQQSLMARLDRLGPAREVAQIGSVIGRGFSYGLLHDVAGMEDAPLQAALEKLADADTLLVQGLPPESDYRFKHALIQDAAYENLLKSRRQVLHRRVAEILRDRFADTATAEPEALAYHFTQAGMTDAAIEWWGKAGDQALRRSAFQEAISHLGKAIEMADKTGESAPRAAATTTSTTERLKLQTNYGQAVMLSRGFASEESKAAFARAQQLAAGTDAAERFSTYFGQWAGCLMRGELTSARQTAEIFLREAESGAGMTEAVTARRLLGLTCFTLGDFEEGHEHLLEALRIYDTERDRDAKFRFGMDSGVCATAYLAFTHWQFAEIAKARRLIDEAVARALESGHAPTEAHIFVFRAIFEILRGDAAAARRDADVVLEVSQKHGIPLYVNLGAIYASWARARLGDRDTEMTKLRQALAAYTEEGNKFWLPFFHGLIAEIEAEGQNAEAAHNQIEGALALSQQTGDRWSDALLHRIRGEILLKRDPAKTASAEEAFLTAIAIAQQQKARSFELRAALSLAKLYQSSGRQPDAHAILAPALKGFFPTPEFPEIEEGLELLAVLVATDEVRTATAARRQRVELQVAYANALISARGHGAEETTAAFARARDLAANIEDPAERFPIYYGIWVGSLVRGEFSVMRDIADAASRDAENNPGLSEVCTGWRIVGVTRSYEGDFVAARAALEKTLATFDPQRDRDLAFRFVQDIGVSATIQLAQTLWAQGEIHRANDLAIASGEQADRTGQVATMVYAHCVHAFLLVVRRDPVRAAIEVGAFATLARKHAMPVWMAYADFLESWVHWHDGHRDDDLGAMRAGIAQAHEQKIALYVPLLETALAGAEAEVDQIDAALASINHALAETGRTGQRWFEAETHRARGDILLRRDPTNTAPAEEAFLTAITVAQQQKAKSFELRAALSLAKLYQSTGRAADAHTVLAPALEGFAPTPEFPEIEEAQTLLAALAETDEVKNAAAARQRRLKLQTSYGQAILWSRGMAAEETKAAFNRAQELAAGVEDPGERFSTYYGVWAGKIMRGEFGAAREIAEQFRREAEQEGRPVEAAVARRILGLTRLWQGEVAAAQVHLEEALRLCDPKYDRDIEARFGQNIGAVATFYLGQAAWVLGDIGPARQLVDEAAARAVETAHVPTQANVNGYRTIFEMLRGDARAGLRTAEALSEISRAHSLAMYAAVAAVCVSWARARLRRSDAGLAELQQAIATYTGQGNKLFLPLFQGLTAEIEAEGEDVGEALAHVGEALALASETGEHLSDALLHRIRGEILLKRDPANTAPAEEAFLTAIAIAQQQKARSFELRAALSLAKLYQNTNRAADAHAVLVPALENFSPTPEFPEIAEAQTLLAALAETEAVKNAAAARQQRLKLQTSLANALLQARGMHSAEAREAFSRARELAGGIEDALQRFSTYYGLWVGGYARSERLTMTEAAEAVLTEAESRPDTAEASIAHRINGVTCWVVGGDIAIARDHLQKALGLYRPERDRELVYRFAQDIGVSATVYLSLVEWIFGQHERSRELITQALSLAGETKHVPTQAYALTHAAIFEMIRLDSGATMRHAETGLDLAREHGLKLWTVVLPDIIAWARAHKRRTLADWEQVRDGLAGIHAQGITTFNDSMSRSWLGRGLADAGRLDEGLGIVDHTIAESERSGIRWFEAESYRVRGEILVRRDPANPAPAEEAFLTAITIAQQQKAKSFELRAALSLAKLYQSTNRAADAHAVLAPALEGFTPTPEFPEIAEAQQLLGSLGL